MSKEQILRQMMGERPTIKNLNVAKEYWSIIEEASKEIESEKAEEKQQDIARQTSQEMAEQAKREFENTEFFNPDDNPFVA